MSLLERMATRRAPTVERRDATLAQMIEVLDRGRQTWSGVPVTPDTAMSHPAVWRCVTLISGLVSSMPIDEFRRVGGIRQPVEPPSPLLLAPSGAISPQAWRSQLLQSGLLHGNAIGVVVARDRMLAPTQVELVDPRTVQIREPKVRAQPPEWKIDGEPVAHHDIWHVAWWSPTGKRFGRSLVDHARQQVGVGLAATEFSARWFGEGAHPTVKVTTPKAIDAAQAKVIKHRIIEATRRNREPIVLGDGLDIEAVQSTPSDSELVATWARNTTDVANFFGVPAELLGGQSSSMTYANLEARALDLLRWCVSLWMAPAEEALSISLGQPVRQAKWNVDAVLRSDTPTRFTAHEKALRGGWRSVNEIRALEDLPPIADGDQFLWPPYTAAPSLELLP